MTRQHAGGRLVSHVYSAVAAIGCADFTTPTGTVVDRQGDTALIRCTGDTDVGQLTLHCVNGSWTPSPPSTGCSATTAATAAVQSFDFGAFALSKQGRIVLCIRYGVACLLDPCEILNVRVK